MSPSNTRNKSGVPTLCTKSASPSRITQSSCEVSSQSRLSSCCNHSADFSSIAGRDGHISNNATTPSLRNSAAGHFQNTHGHSHATNLTDLSALGDHVTNQAQGDLVMQRYLNETDQYREFLVGSQNDQSQNSQVVTSNLEERNYGGNDSIPPRENDKKRPKL